jgi:phosphoribosylformylglycinamidine synthase
MLSDTSWVSSQYDHMLFLNTVEGPGGDRSKTRSKTRGKSCGKGGSTPPGNPG